MTKYARCDSCGGIYPEEMVKEVKYSYTVFNHASKDRLVTTDVYGMLCPNCGQQKPTTTEEKAPTTSARTTKSTSSSGRKR